MTTTTQREALQPPTIRSEAIAPRINRLPTESASPEEQVLEEVLRRASGQIVWFNRHANSSRIAYTSIKLAQLSPAQWCTTW